MCTSGVYRRARHEVRVKDRIVYIYIYIYMFPHSRLEHLEHVSRMIDDWFAEVDGPSKGERFKVNRGGDFFSRITTDIFLNENDTSR